MGKEMEWIQRQDIHFKCTQVKNIHLEYQLKETRGLQFAIQERDTSTVLVMHDAHCSKEYAAKMTELDEQSDLGHQDHLSI